jgi:hypothetical protein
VEDAMKVVYRDNDWIRWSTTLALVMETDYWSRLWIMQEIMLSKTIVLLCEVPMLCEILSISWESLAGIFDNCRDVAVPAGAKLAFRIEDVPGSLRHLLVQKTWGGGDLGNRPLKYAIEAFGHLECQDVRDKIFGLLSLVHKDMRIVVDYSMNTVDLFFEVLEAVVADEGLINYGYHQGFAVMLRGVLNLDDVLSDEELDRFGDYLSETYMLHDEEYCGRRAKRRVVFGPGQHSLSCGEDTEHRNCRRNDQFLNCHHSQK